MRPIRNLSDEAPLAPGRSGERLRGLHAAVAVPLVDPSPMAVGPGVARFRHPAGVGLPDRPFPGYVSPLRASAQEEALPSVRPRFGHLGRWWLVDVAVEPGTSLYGTGEQAGSLLRNGTRKVLWNTDCPDYTDETPALYQSHPWVLGVRGDGSAFGVLVETTWRTVIDLTRGIRFETLGPPPAVLVIERDSALEVARALAELTGRIPMPPRWALGYHQCRWSYESEAKAREIASGFRSRGLPCDAIWLDIDYMDGFRCFTFSKEAFPDPKRLNADLHRDGFRTVWMIDPGLKVDPKYAVFERGRRGRHYVTTAEGKEFHGKVWPGDCAFPDFTRARTRAWWGGLYKEFLAHGIDGVWNDMNEPALFECHSRTMPEDNRHEADEDLGGPGTHAQYHNIYGMQMVRATFEGVKASRPERRAFVLTRAGFLGSQRFGATWTGDNRSSWAHLAWAIPSVLNLGLSGQPFVGPDIGGFLGDADAALFARFMGIGALLPFARGHSDKKSGPHEPWAFGKACEATCRRALTRRYRLLPYLYTLFHEAATTGAPIVRPAFVADPCDVRWRACETMFLLGNDVLVSCDVDRHADGGDAFLPRGGWIPFEPGTLGTEESWTPDADLPRVYVRAGAVVPLGPAMQHTGEKPIDPLTLVVAPDADGRATGTLYEDAGDGDALATGDYALTRFSVSDGGSAVREERIGGRRKVPARMVRPIVVPPRGAETR